MRQALRNSIKKITISKLAKKINDKPFVSMKFCFFVESLILHESGIASNCKMDERNSHEYNGNTTKKILARFGSIYIFPSRQFWFIVVMICGFLFRLA